MQGDPHGAADDGARIGSGTDAGAHGVMMGTRFSAASESLTREQAKARLVAARAVDTVKTRVVDIVRGYASWPEPYTGRVLRNDFCALARQRKRACSRA